MAAETLTPENRQVLGLVYETFRARGSWPAFAVVDRRLDQAGLDAADALGRLPNVLVRGERFGQGWIPPTQEISLSLTGVAAVAEARADLDRLAALVGWLAEQDRVHDPDATGEALTVAADRALAAIGIDIEDPSNENLVRRLGSLLDLVPGLWSARSSSSDGAAWSMTIARGIRRYRGVAAADDLLARVVGPGAEVVENAPPRPLDESSVQPDGDDSYDVALSFAGEERPYVERVAARLNDLGVLVFYDQFETIELWGTNLLDRFGDVYGRRAKYVVMFVSAAYAEKAWTNEERRHAQALALETRRDLVLPVRFDDTRVPGLPATVHYLAAADYTPTELAELIAQKVDRAGTRQIRERGPEMAAPGLTTAPSATLAAAATPILSTDPDDLATWTAPHRARALEGLAELSKSDFYEVVAAVSPRLPMPTQKRLADSVASKNIDTFGWPIGVFIATQPPQPVVDGIVTEIKWAERGTYDYWTLARTGTFYLLKTLSEDPLDAPDKLYFNTRIIRVAETILFLASLYQELGAASTGTIHVEVVHAGIRHRTLSAVGARRGTFRDRHTTEDRVRTTATFTITDVDNRLVDIVKELVGPLFMVYEYLEVADGIYSDLIDRFREGYVT
ncbi:MAG TPA: TIR domain-containing protein [Candidatus Limnocylindrales bacterium]|nr:TIR domain-containing protein [Candidatus Limnocylindrales bacterium]